MAACSPGTAYLAVIYQVGALINEMTGQCEGIADPDVPDFKE